MGLKFKYEHSKYKESSFTLNSTFFSLNDISDISLLPLDSIGFYTIKNKLYESNNLIQLNCKLKPEINNIVIAHINNNNYLAQIFKIIDKEYFEIILLETSKKIKIKSNYLTVVEIKNQMIIIYLQEK